MKIMVTGFDPFGGERVNPAYEAVKLLPDNIKGAEIIKVEIPTVFYKGAEKVEEAIVKYKPDVVICVGQAGGRSTITIEKVAINLQEARIQDNQGNQPLDKTIQEDGENAYFATIPVKAMVANVRKNGIPCNISYTAGTYVCNDVMYNLLYLADKKYKNLIGGFIHVPYAMEQVVDKANGVASMSLESIANGLKYSIEAIVENKVDINEAMGTIM